MHPRGSACFHPFRGCLSSRANSIFDEDLKIACLPRAVNLIEIVIRLLVLKETCSPGQELLITQVRPSPIVRYQVTSYNVSAKRNRW